MKFYRAMPLMYDYNFGLMKSVFGNTIIYVFSYVEFLFKILGK